MLTLTQWPLLTGLMTVGLVILEINILNIKRDIISKMSGVFSQILSYFIIIIIIILLFIILNSATLLTS